MNNQEVPKSYMPADNQIDKFPVQTFQTQCKCPELGCEGYLGFTGQRMAGLILTPYLHVCDRCEVPRMLADQYPAITTERHPGNAVCSSIDGERYGERK